MNTVIHNIKIIISNKGLKKKSVADKAGYTKQQFSDLLNGRKTIKSDDVLRIAIALEVTPNDLFGITA
jgi:DNA-binding Xre family transcriptional regulator